MDGIQFIRTSDGSNTLFHAGTGEYYHSIHGAIQESRHVFLESGLKYRQHQRGSDLVSKKISVSPYIGWEIIHRKALDFETNAKFDVIYFDAFSEKSQPEMWTIQTLDHICRQLAEKGFW